ncbi:MAG: hypothetical protein MMC33_004034 [Icmadophila ericetorum]|nr:hypothetical protein [Icmadophila ericetorum]
MAPKQPSGVSKSSHSNQRQPNDVVYGLTSTKEDKRRMKRSSLISRIEKKNIKPAKPRRPSRKLVANLESLVDALPELSKEEVVVGNARIRQKSLKSRPGAMKKKQKLEVLEKDRFAKNLAQMVELPSKGTRANDALNASSADTSERWAALRGYIRQTMDQAPTLKPST